MSRAENKIKGNIGESAAIYEFIKYEIPVAVPFGDNERYDLIAEFNEKLNRIQVKYCDYWNNINAVTCPCSSSTNHTALRKERETYINDIDFFVFYIPKKECCLLVPIDYIGDKKTININFSEQKPNYECNWYKDFLFENYFSKQKIIDNITNHCIDCNAEITHKAIRCVKCQNIYQRQQVSEEKPVTREELKNLIRTLPFTQIGKQFSVTDNAIRKWCDFYKLPRTKGEINFYSDEDWELI